MKTLILYATKYGAAGEIARRIASRIDGAVVHDLKQGNVPPLDDFDCVIVGSSLYVGKIRKEARAFAADNAADLCKKTVGLYLTGLEAENTEPYFTSNFPGSLLRGAKASAFLGGIYDPARAGVFDKLLLKAAKKSTGYMNTLSDEKIAEFAEALKA